MTFKVGDRVQLRQDVPWVSDPNKFYGYAGDTGTIEVIEPLLTYGYFVRLDRTGCREPFLAQELRPLRRVDNTPIRAHAHADT